MPKKITKFIVSLLLILGIALGAIYFFVKSHKEEVVNFIVNTVSENHNGTVSFDDVTLKNWGNFTNPAFHVKNMVLLDSTESQITRFQAEDVYLKLSINSLLKKNIQVKSLQIENANYKSVVIKEDLVTLTVKKDSTPKKNKVTDIFKPYKMKMSIEDFTIDIQNIPRHKAYRFKLNEITSDLLMTSDRISSSLDLDANIKQLGFNLQKGSYLKDTKIIGSMNPEIDLISDKIHIPAFDLSINDQIFKLTADFDTAGSGSFHFIIVNEETEYAPTVSLVSDHIQEKLGKYKIDQPFSTHTTLEGSFAPFSNPLVHIEFNSDDNTATIIDRFDLESLSFNGCFTNRIYDDERAKTEDKKDSKLKFSSVTGIYKETKFELNSGMLISTPKDKALIKGSLKVDGIPENLVSLTNKPIFTLKGGRFNLMAELEGDATSAVDLLNKSNIKLEVRNTGIFDIEDEIFIPVNQLDIRLKEDRAVLEILDLPLSSSDQLNIYGHVNRFSSLLTKEAEIQATTTLGLKSTKLRWEDFMNIFANSNKGPKDKVKQPAYVIRDIARKIYLKFNPSVAVDIKEFGYESFQLTNFFTDLTFSDVNHLHLYNTTFDISDGTVKLKADLDLEQPKQILIDADIDASGTPEILNDIFNNDTFFFNGGSFSLNGKVYGDVLQMDDFLNALNGTIRLTNSSIFYQPNNLTVPINLFDVQIDNNLVVLNSLEIGIGEKDKLNFSGRLENFSAFLSSTNTDQVNSYINLHSDRLQWEDFLSVFQKGIKKEKKDSVTSINNSVKETVRGLYTKFNPKLGITIDKFEYKDLIVVENFFTGLDFDGQNSLILEESGFDFNKKIKVEFKARLDISESVGTDIDMDFRAFGDPAQLNEILNYDTFLLQGGDIEITAKASGDIENINELVSSASAMFKIENSALIHNTSKVRIPFSILEIDILNDDAVLKSLNIELPSGDKIKLYGELKNITSIIPEISANYERMSSKLNIYSKKIRFSDFLDLFNNVDAEEKVENSNPNLALKTVVKDFYNKYQPELSINLDEFIFNKLIINNFNTGFYFENEDLLYLENTAFDFYKGKVTLDAHLDITDPHETGFSIGFTTDNLDLEKLLISFDYFDIPSIKEADKIDGKVSVDTRIEGDLLDSTGIISNSLKGTIGFDLQEMQIKGFDPIIKVGNLIFKKKRFEDIRFGSIENILYVANNTVEIPLMQIQSTALDFFVDGHLGYQEVPTNLWTGIPLTNFKSRDLVDIPNKTGYIESGKKVYIEAKSGKNNKIKYKLHFSERKYFKERELLSEYRIMVKEDRLLRRKYKRDSRAEEKLQKSDSTKIN